MDITESLNLNSLKSPRVDESTKSGNLSNAQKEKFAKDFESIFISKLFDEMKNTIGDWGGEQDGASQQIQGLFWLNLAQDVSKNGGLGLWKDIYQSLNDIENNTNPSKNLDNML